MRRIIVAAAAVLAFAPAPARAQIITSIAGNGTEGFCGDGGPATSACVVPWGVAADGKGNVFVADFGNRVRKIDAAGTVTTVAGNGTQGFCGDGGPATSACLDLPQGVAVDAAGNLFIADSQNNRIRRVDVTGTITTYAGTGFFEACGDGGPATNACISRPMQLAVDAAGNLYIADWGNSRIRKVTTGGTITTVAGGGTAGFCGDGGPATSACLDHPGGVAVASDGQLFIADSWNHRLRKVDSAGTISTLAGKGWLRNGSGGGFCGDGHAAVAACLSFPFGVAVDAAGNVFIADNFNHRVRKIDAAGIITTVAGSKVQGFCGDGGNGIEACLDRPYGVGVDTADGSLLIADTFNWRVRRLEVVPGAFALSKTLLSGCLPSHGKVTLDAPAPSGGTTVSFWSNNANATVPAHLTIKAGALTKSVSVTTSAVATEETATITADGPGWTRAITIRLTPMVAKKLTFSPNPVVGGSLVSATVTLECAAGPADLLVTLASAKPSVAAPIGATVTVPFGTKSAPFDLTTEPVAKRTKAAISATTAGGTKTQSLTVN